MACKAKEITFLKNSKGEAELGSSKDVNNDMDYCTAVGLLELKKKIS